MNRSFARSTGSRLAEHRPEENPSAGMTLGVALGGVAIASIATYFIAKEILVKKVINECASSLGGLVGSSAVARLEARARTMI